jgi:hypothetical protein
MFNFQSILSSFLFYFTFFPFPIDHINILTIYHFWVAVKTSALFLNLPKYTYVVGAATHWNNKQVWFSGDVFVGNSQIIYFLKKQKMYNIYK